MAASRSRSVRGADSAAISGDSSGNVYARADCLG